MRRGMRRKLKKFGKSKSDRRRLMRKYRKSSYGRSW